MNLTDQVDFLKAKLLDAVVSEFPESLSLEDQVLVSSFLVLCHASIEEALEDAFRNHCHELARACGRNTIPGNLARLFFSMRPHLDSMLAGQSDLDTCAIAKICLAGFEQTFVNSNNGLKQENVRKLANGAGIYWPDFENALSVGLNDLTTLGTKRGSVGHLSPFTSRPVAITNSTDPSDVLRWVESGVIAVSNIESFLLALRSQS